MHLEERQQREAFARAVQKAVSALHRTWRDQSQLNATFAIFQLTSHEAQVFVQAAVEELLLSATPDLGRLLDLYRRELRFTAALRNQPLPDWEAIRPVLIVFLSKALPEAMQQEQELRPLVLEQAQLQILNELRIQRTYAQAQTAILQRLATMLEEMLLQPRIQATVTAGAGSSIANAPVTVLLGSYRTLPDNSQPDLAALYARYCDYVYSEYALLDFRGILQLRNATKLPLEAIYVPLHGSARSPAQTFEGESSRELKGAAELTPRTSEHNDADATGLHRLICTTPQLVILGDPGSGKSTLVKYVLLSLLRDETSAPLGLTGAWLPILFPVAAFAEARTQQYHLAPLDHLRDFYRSQSQPDFGELFTRALLSGRALLLFDGLDEVRDSADRLSIVRCLEAFVRTWDLPGNRFLATSRIAGYAEAPLDPNLFVQTEVRPFTTDAIRLFAHKWSAAYERAGRDETASETEIQRRTQQHERALTDAIFANENAADLARNPLLLTMLAGLRAQEVTLPDRRVELYALIIKALAQTWNGARSLSKRP
ncbi:MAG: NACHT domain-containing protein, partial [Chloroflexales bacterium]